MKNEQLKQELLRLNNEYANGLDYIKNNPHISVAEVQEHLKTIKERNTVLELLYNRK